MYVNVYIFCITVNCLIYCTICMYTHTCIIFTRNNNVVRDVAPVFKSTVCTCLSCM